MNESNDTRRIEMNSPKRAQPNSSRSTRNRRAFQTALERRLDAYSGSILPERLHLGAADWFDGQPHAQAVLTGEANWFCVIAHRMRGCPLTTGTGAERAWHQWSGLRQERQKLGPVLCICNTHTMRPAVEQVVSTTGLRSRGHDKHSHGETGGHCHASHAYFDRSCDQWQVGHEARPRMEARGCEYRRSLARLCGVGQSVGERLRISLQKRGRT